MSGIIYLTEEQIILMNTFLIKKISPNEIIGVKEPSALNMCIESMKQTAFGKEVYPTLEEKAAILFINLIKKHCFHNGNKRTAYMALHAFLRTNGLILEINSQEAINLCVEIATWDNSQFDQLKFYVIEIIKAKTIPFN